MKRGSKKGISPVIATILLIAIVVVIWLIVFLWFKGISEEAITKFDGKNIERVCIDDVKFEVNYESGEIFIENNGNVPIYGMNLKFVNEDGSYNTKEIKEIASWPESGLSSGSVFSEDISSEIPTNTEKIIASPILMGNSNKGKQQYSCDATTSGEEVYIK